MKSCNFLYNVACYFFIKKVLNYLYQRINNLKDVEI